MISKEEFEERLMEASEITKWRDLEVGKIYYIVDWEIINTQIGESMKLTLKDDLSLITVWAPQRVRKTIERKHCTHICSNGLRKGAEREYWAFDAIVYKWTA